MTLVDVNVVRDAADIRLVTIDHHSDFHIHMLRHREVNVKWKELRVIKSNMRKIMVAKLILRDKVYEVRPGMSLLDALKKSNIVPESVIAIRDGEMITDDEILRSGDEVKLVAVISGG